MVLFLCGISAKLCRVNENDNEALALYWDKDHVLMLVGKNSDAFRQTIFRFVHLRLRFIFDVPVFLVSESDSILLFSNYNVELLYRVPDVAVQIFQVGTQYPANMLFEAAKNYAVVSWLLTHLICF